MSRPILIAVTLILCFGGWDSVEAQPGSPSMGPTTPVAFAPSLPPIPNPPYPHTVRFCGIANNATFSLSGNGTDQCNWTTYVESFIPILAAPIVLAAIALVLSIVIPFLFCFPCCKRDQIMGLVKIALVAAFGVVLVTGFILIFVGNAQTSNSISSLQFIITTTLGIAEDRLQEAINLGSQLPYTNTSSALQTFQSVESTLQGFSNETVTIGSRVSHYNTLRQAAIFVGALVPLFLAGAGAALIIFTHVKPAIGTIAWLLVFLSVVVWICIGLHVAIGKGLSDICYEVDLAEAQGSAGALSILVKCQTDKSPLHDVQVLIQSAIQNATYDACNATESTCVANGGVVDCTLPSWTCNRTTLDQWPLFNMTDQAEKCVDIVTSQVTYVDPRNGCPVGTTSGGLTTPQVLLVEQCPTQCKNPTFASDATTGISDINQLEKYYNISDQLMPILNCRFVADAFTAARGSVCTDLQHELTLIFVGGALEAFGMGLGMATLIHVFMGLSGDPMSPTNPRNTL